MTPRRIQRKRTKGWRMPPNTRCVTRPGKWGNPYRVGVDGSLDWCLNAYRDWIEACSDAGRLDVRDLRGLDLACFCRLDQPCHADILLELANPTK